MIPREASRVHATILRKKASETAIYFIRDENSRAGTFVNGRRVSAADPADSNSTPPRLAAGDVISLGPSGINSYVFVELGEGTTATTNEGEINETGTDAEAFAPPLSFVATAAAVKGVADGKEIRWEDGTTTQITEVFPRDKTQQGPGIAQL